MLGSSPAPLVVCAYSEGQKCCWVMLRGCWVTEQGQALGLCHACCQVSEWHRPRGCLELLHHHYLMWGDRCGLQQFPFVLITNTAWLLGSNSSFSHVLRQLGSRVWLSACAVGNSRLQSPLLEPLWSGWGDGEGDEPEALTCEAAGGLSEAKTFFFLLVDEMQAGWRVC